MIVYLFRLPCTGSMTFVFEWWHIVHNDILRRLREGGGRGGGRMCAHACIWVLKAVQTFNDCSLSLVRFSLPVPPVCAFCSSSFLNSFSLCQHLDTSMWKWKWVLDKWLHANTWQFASGIHMLVNNFGEIFSRLQFKMHIFYKHENIYFWSLFGQQ